MSRAFIFPGQGSQAVGMGKALADNFIQARAVFEEVNEALLQPLSTLMFEGPEADLTLTANAQPALMAVSLATIRVLQAEAGLDLSRDAAFVAGHSLGEYSALAASGALSIWDTARLLQKRGQAMQAAVPVGQGAMAALLGADLDQAREIAGLAQKAVSGVCEVANDNGGGQVVVVDGKVVAEVALPVCGLISDQPLETVAAQLDRVVEVAHSIGITLDAPFMSLSFLGLSVIPDLRITDLGLIDVNLFAQIPVAL